MKSVVSVAVMALLVAAGSVVAGGEPPADPPEPSISPIPATLFAKSPDPFPIWVSVQEAVDLDGNLRADRLSPGALGNLESRARTDQRIGPAGGPAYEVAAKSLKRGSRIPLEACSAMVSAVWHEFDPEREPKDALATLLGKSQSVLLGTITGIEQGFVSISRTTSGVPATLLRVEVDDIIAGKRPAGSLSSIYLYYHDARFQIGDTAFCSLNFDDYADFYPVVGQRVLYFQWDGPEDQGQELFTPHPAQIAFASAEGRILSAPYLRDEVSVGESLDRLVERVRGADSLTDSVSQGAQ